MAAVSLSCPQVRRQLRWAFLGRVEYCDAVAVQESLREQVRRGEEPESLLLLEHPHVYTLGRSADRSEILADSKWLSDRGVEVAESDRGGQVTYHGPGQLVGYPILDLSPDRRDLRRYMRDLMEVLVRTLADFEVTARARPKLPELGVWSGERKLASVGVHVSRWITTHGFALNVTTDLSYFSGIVPCGLQSDQMGTIETMTGVRPSLEEVAGVVVRYFCDVFERRALPVGPDDLTG